MVMISAPDNFIGDGVISPYFLEIVFLFFIIYAAYLSKNLIKGYIKMEF
jgi:hypothetical protein